MYSQKRIHVLKAKVNDYEKNEFMKMKAKSGMETDAEFLRSLIFLTERQKMQREQQAQKISREQLVEEKMLLSHMHSVINQYKAGVEKDKAINLLEEDVNKLCHILDF